MTSVSTGVSKKQVHVLLKGHWLFLTSQKKQKAVSNFRLLIPTFIVEVCHRILQVKSVWHGSVVWREVRGRSDVLLLVKKQLRFSSFKNVRFICHRLNHLLPGERAPPAGQLQRWHWKKEIPATSNAGKSPEDVKLRWILGVNLEFSFYSKCLNLIWNQLNELLLVCFYIFFFKPGTSYLRNRLLKLWTLQKNKNFDQIKNVLFLFQEVNRRSNECGRGEFFFSVNQQLSVEFVSNRTVTIIESVTAFTWTKCSSLSPDSCCSVSSADGNTFVFHF